MPREQSWTEIHLGLEIVRQLLDVGGFDRACGVLGSSDKRLANATERELGSFTGVPVKRMRRR
eukprot:1355095-Prorocentrum_lima.AAC.1